MLTAVRLVLSLCLLLSTVPLSAGITRDPLGPYNAGGTRNGADIAIGAGGTVYELEAFLYIPGEDLNGSNQGVVARLSADALPTGLVCVATNELLDADSDLVLTYTFRNDGTQDVEWSRFFSFLDAEIDEDLNTFFNEYGVVDGGPGDGPGDPEPDFWQIDEPGFMQGQILELLLDGTLGQTNGVPPDDVDDVSMALGFDLGRLRPGESATVNVMISEDGGSLGEPTLRHYDAGAGVTVPTGGLDDDGTNGTVIAYSGTTKLLPDLTNVVVDGAVLVHGGDAESYLATAFFTDATTQDVTAVSAWALSGSPPAGTTLAGNELLTVPVTQDVPVAVSAVYTYRGVTMTGTLDVVVLTEQAFLNVTEDVALGFTWRQNYSTGELMGRMTVENTGAAPLTGPFQLALKPHDDFFFHLPDGEMPDGDEYRDLTAGFAAALPGVGDGDRVFDPGETVVVDDIAIYSRDRSPPPVTVFELWATSGVGGDAD